MVEEVDGGGDTGTGLFAVHRMLHYHSFVSLQPV